MITSKRLAHLAKSTIVLPFLLAALLGLGLQARATFHATTTVTSSSHYMADVDPYPPGH